MKAFFPIPLETTGRFLCSLQAPPHNLVDGSWILPKRIGDDLLWPDTLALSLCILKDCHRILEEMRLTNVPGNDMHGFPAVHHPLPHAFMAYLNVERSLQDC